MVTENFFIQNNQQPYSNIRYDEYADSISIDFYQAMFLPDNTNIVKIFAYIIEDNGASKMAEFEVVNKIEGNIFDPKFFESFIIEEITPHEDTYILILYATFEDMFKADDILFSSYIFGFSLLRMFELKMNSKVSKFWLKLGLRSFGREILDPNLPCQLPQTPQKWDNWQVPQRQTLQTPGCLNAPLLQPSSKEQ